MAMGETSEPVCEMPVEQNKIGLVLIGGLNPVAAAEEAGIDTDNLAMDFNCESLWEKMIGKPYSGKPNVRFDEGKLEICYG